MFKNSGRAARRASALAVLSVAVIACSGNPPSSTTGGDGLGAAQPPDATDAPAGSDGGLSSAPAPAGSPGVVTGHVGDKLIVTMLSGSKADLTLVKVADPATLAHVDVDNSPAGARWVGLEITSVDHSPFAGQESVQVDAIGSDGTLLTTDNKFKGFSHLLGAFKECTPAGAQDTDQTNTICTGFLVPTGVTLKSVGAKVGGAEVFETGAEDQAIWMVP
jgi:hypothetical protein